MKRRASEILVLLALCLPLFLFADRACAGSNRYRDAEYGFSFDYPGMWEEEGDEAMRGTLSVIVYAEPVDRFAANFSVLLSTPHGLASMTAAELAKGYEDAEMSDLKILSFRRDIFLGEACVVVDFRWTDDTYRIRQRQYLIDRGRQGYTLTLTALQSNFDEYEGAFKGILDSFAF